MTTPTRALTFPEWSKKFQFALSAFGVNPETVVVTVVHDSVEIVCDPQDERCVGLAVKLCMPECHNDWKMLTFAARYGSTAEEIKRLWQ